MLAKNWKKILLIILIVLCLINAIFKLVKVVSFDKTINLLKQKFTTTQKQEPVEKNEDKTTKKNNN